MTVTWRAVENNKSGLTSDAVTDKQYERTPDAVD